ncbi:MAG: FixH family protein [Rhodocyclaceae bacterium]|mgnify:FL=1
MKKIDPASKPWYREPWPWILMAGPAIVVVAGIATAWLAVRSNDGLVEDDYYKKGLAVSQQIARDQEAAGLGLSGELMLGATSEVRLLLNARQGGLLSDSVALRVIHPTRSGNDQSIVLTRDGSGFYSGRLSSPLSGRWHVQVEDQQKRWRLAAEWNVDKQPALHLQAANIAPSVSN